MREIILILLLLLSSCAEEFDPVPEPIRIKKLQKENEKEQEKKDQVCDEEDVNLFKQSAYFSDSWSRCARASKGSIVHTSRCLQKEYIDGEGRSRLRGSCASCFGAFASCGYDNCFWTCAPSAGRSETCERCGWQHCGNALEACLGLPRTHLARYFY
ncbi:MAG: hypothetical protein BWZ03_00397 [bacterium ADurb.BinA186]|nr:MAG: hypothetical protein BWZ03_00397 [bacterium ADurb.BinA186]